MEAAFQSGDVVYFLTPDKRSVDFGICKDFYCDDTAYRHVHCAHQRRKK